VFGFLKVFLIKNVETNLKMLNPLGPLLIIFNFSMVLNIIPILMIVTNSIMMMIF